MTLPVNLSIENLVYDTLGVVCCRMFNKIKVLLSSKSEPDQFSLDAAVLSNEIEVIMRNFTHNGLISRYPALYNHFVSLVSKVSKLRECKPADRGKLLEKIKIQLRNLIDGHGRLYQWNLPEARMKVF